MTEAEGGLLEKARRTLRSARLLAADGDYDGAASRAYYCMFYVAEALLLSKDMSYSSHAAVISAFGREFAKQGVLPAEYHRYLIEAQAARNTGDYQVVSRLTDEVTEQHIGRAERFLDAGEEFLREGSEAGE